MAFSYLGRGRSSSGDTTGGPTGPRFAILSQVRAYWEALREGGALPRRDQIDPRGIAGALEQVFLIERIAPGLARFRLSGMGINELVGMDVRGMPMSALFNSVARDRVSPALETVFRENMALDVELEAERGIGRPALEARMILLPLVSTRGLTDLALGCLAVEGPCGRAPRRFVISALHSEILLVARQSFPQSGPHAMISGFATSKSRFVQPQAEFSEAQAEFTPLRPPRGKPQLRLVKSGD